MKVSTPEIVWHGKEPVFTADFHSRGGQTWRLATGGADNDVKIWKVIGGDDDRHKLKVLFMSNLSRHTKAVNVVRFSPSGHLLASAGDDNVVCLWKLCEGVAGGNLECADSGVSSKESWTVTKMLRGHLEDIYDLCWSQGSEFIVTGSVDNSAIVWDVQKGQSLAILKESSQYVQGVAWDPLGQFIATISSDRNLRVYSTESKMKCLHTVSKLSLPDKSGSGVVKHFKMWMDEGVSSFFRRLTFTPCGTLLIVPAGRFEGESVKNTTYIFTRNNLTRPVLQLPASDKATVAVRCCPVLFLLRRPSVDTPQAQPPPLINLPYRVVYAVASLDSVLLYDTQHSVPFAYLSNIHYTGITDLTWSNDGSILVITSSDGYCSLVTFDPGELGEPLPLEQTPAVIGQCRTGSTTADSNGGHSPPISSSSVHSSPPSPPSHPSQQTPELKPTDIKPRRIHPTVVSTFSQNGNSKTVSPSTGLTGGAQDDGHGDIIHCDSRERTQVCGVMDTESESGTVTGSSVSNSLINEGETISNQSGVSMQKKARRINLITLSSFPSSSTNPDTSSVRRDGRNVARATAVETDIIACQSLKEAGQETHTNCECSESGLKTEATISTEDEPMEVH